MGDRMTDRQLRTDPTGEPLTPAAAVSEDLLRELQTVTPWAPRADRRNSRQKFYAGLRGLKYAVRGDSSFFAHGYRGILIAMTAVLLRVDPLGWCLLVISATLVLLAELTHSAVDTLARGAGDPDSPPMKAAREIAAACVLVAAFATGALTLAVLAHKFGVLLGWWD